MESLKNTQQLLEQENHTFAANCREISNIVENKKSNSFTKKSKYTYSTTGKDDTKNNTRRKSGSIWS